MARLVDKDELIKNELKEFYSNKYNSLKHYLENDFINPAIPTTEFDTNFMFTKQTHIIKYKNTISNQNANDFKLENTLTVIRKDIPRSKKIIFKYLDNNEFESIESLDDITNLTTYKDLLNIYNECFGKIFTGINFNRNFIPETQLNNLKYDYGFTKKDITISELKSIPAQYIDDYLKLLLYRINVHNQGVYGFTNNLFNIANLFILFNNPKIFIYDDTLKTISVVLIIVLSTSRGLIKFGKVIIVKKIDQLNENDVCIMELDFDFNIDDKLSLIEKSKKLFTTIMEYSIEFYNKTNINVLQGLYSKKDIIMTARENLGHTKLKSQKPDITGFYNKDCTGINKTGFLQKCKLKKLKKTCYYEPYKFSNDLNNNSKYSNNYNNSKMNTEHYKSIDNICTYNGLLNFFDIEGETIIDKIIDFKKIYDNDASNLLIVTDIETIYSIFGILNISNLDFILINSERIVLYNKKNDYSEYNETVLYENIKGFEFVHLTNTNHENLDFKCQTLYEKLKLKTFQNIYFIVHPKTLESNEKLLLYDNPLSFEDVNFQNIKKFIIKIREICKIGLNIVLTSYLSVSILTGALIKNFLPMSNFKFQEDIVTNNCNSILKIFMLICFIRNYKYLVTINSKANTSNIFDYIKSKIEYLGELMVSFIIADMKHNNITSSTPIDLKNTIYYQILIFISTNKTYLDNPNNFLRFGDNLHQTDENPGAFDKLDIVPIYYKKLFRTLEADHYKNTFGINSISPKKLRFNNSSNKNERFRGSQSSTNTINLVSSNNSSSNNSSSNNSSNGNSTVGGFKFTKNKKNKLTKKIIVKNKNHNSKKYKKTKNRK